ncbi:hypothetical protein CDD83_1676 [Cordyceps sp. RAO-2017]|nr:hypothetical protein CDD83_1676 [Cordyceps sp. RAO-2017]
MHAEGRRRTGEGEREARQDVVVAASSVGHGGGGGGRSSSRPTDSEVAVVALELSGSARRAVAVSTSNGSVFGPGEAERERGAKELKGCQAGPTTDGRKRALFVWPPGQEAGPAVRGGQAVDDDRPKQPPEAVGTESRTASVWSWRG